MKLNLEEWITNSGRDYNLISLESIFLLEEMVKYYENKKEPTLFTEAEVSIKEPNPNLKKKSKIAAQDNFLKELQDMDVVPEKTTTPIEELPSWQEQIINATPELSPDSIFSSENEEMKKLKEELNTDKKEGLLLEEEPFYVKNKKLFVNRYKDQIEVNIKGLAKNITDTKWKQSIDINNVNVIKKSKAGVDSYISIVCTNSYGVGFNILMSEVYDKLLKIPFE
jgi:hypothetical protein